MSLLHWLCHVLHSASPGGSGLVSALGISLLLLER